MPQPAADNVFSGSIPELYERLMVPLIFEPYADDIVARLLPRNPKRVLEIAAGTGVVTRRLAERLPAAVAIVSTDLNPPMIARAEAIGTVRPVTWRVADAMALPFDAGSFDAVVCQFGAMFFPDKPHAYTEARRVLAPGGVFLFNVWGPIEANAFPHAVIEALADLYPSDPPRFLARTPHGYFDRAKVEADLRGGGFASVPEVATVVAQSRAESPRAAATALCLGTPLRAEIEARDPGGLERAVDGAAAAIAKRFGHGAVEGAIQADVYAVTA